MTGPSKTSRISSERTTQARGRPTHAGRIQQQASKQSLARTHLEYYVDEVVLKQEEGDKLKGKKVTVMGQTIDGSDLAGGLLLSDPINDAPFDCSSGTPVLQFETGSGRTPVALTPAS